MTEKNQFIAVDLGSNSFHLAHLEYRNNKLHSVQVLKDLVRMASGISDHGTLNKDCKSKVLRCLEQFNHYIAQHPNVVAQAVGTSSFRRLENEPGFIEHAEHTLGLKINILSGSDEAQFIYHGVTLGRPNLPRIIIDIGGGSTEIAVGNAQFAEQWESLNQGSLRLSDQFFKDRQITEEVLIAAETHVDDALATHASHLKSFQFEEAFGASGSVKSVLWALQHLGLTKKTITLEALNRARSLIYQVNNLDQMSQLLNLNLRRTMLFPAGFVILRQIMIFFNIESLDISYQAIREGLAARYFQEHDDQ